VKGYHFFPTGHGQSMYNGMYVAHIDPQFSGSHKQKRRATFYSNSPFPFDFWRRGRDLCIIASDLDGYSQLCWSQKLF